MPAKYFGNLEIVICLTMISISVARDTNAQSTGPAKTSDRISLNFGCIDIEAGPSVNPSEIPADPESGGCPEASSCRVLVYCTGGTADGGAAISNHRSAGP